MVGYPITTETNLSILKAAKLLQALVDVTGMAQGGSDGNNDSNNAKPKLPESIERCVAKVLSAQKEMIEEVDNYLHSIERKVDEIETVTSIVETCPEFLATKDTDGDLPIHCFAWSLNKEAVVEYVPLLAEIGRKHRIGGEEGRGGLVVENNNGYNALHHLLYNDSSNVMEKLKCADPPLLVKEDVWNYSLIHDAVDYKSIEMVKYLVQLDPSCLYYNHIEYGIPLSQVYLYNDGEEIDEERKKCLLKIMKYLLHEAISYDATNATIGGLFVKDGNGLILDSLIENYGPEDTWSCIKQALSSFADIPILHKVIEHSPQNFNSTITHFPNSVLVRDVHNRLPVHVALECGMKWSQDLVFMMHGNRDHLKDVDPVTKFPPFVLAALDDTASSSCDLSTIYYLLRENPEHVEIFFNKKEKKNRKKRNSNVTINTISNSSTNKRRRSRRLR